MSRQEVWLETRKYGFLSFIVPVAIILIQLFLFSGNDVWEALFGILNAESIRFWGVIIDQIRTVKALQRPDTVQTEHTPSPIINPPILPLLVHHRNRPQHF